MKVREYTLDNDYLVRLLASRKRLKEVLFKFEFGGYDQITGDMREEVSISKHGTSFGYCSSGLLTELASKGMSKHFLETTQSEIESYLMDGMIDNSLCYNFVSIPFPLFRDYVDKYLSGTGIDYVARYHMHEALTLPTLNDEVGLSFKQVAQLLNEYWFSQHDQSYKVALWQQPSGDYAPNELEGVKHFVVPMVQVFNKAIEQADPKLVLEYTINDS